MDIVDGGASRGHLSASSIFCRGVGRLDEPPERMVLLGAGSWPDNGCELMQTGQMRAARSDGQRNLSRLDRPHSGSTADAGGLCAGVKPHENLLMVQALAAASGNRTHPAAAQQIVAGRCTIRSKSAV